MFEIYLTNGIIPRIMMDRKLLEYKNKQGVKYLTNEKLVSDLISSAFGLTLSLIFRRRKIAWSMTTSSFLNTTNLSESLFLTGRTNPKSQKLLRETAEKREIRMRCSTRTKKNSFALYPYNYSSWQLRIRIDKGKLP
jgi:hypothetical protein